MNYNKTTINKEIKIIGVKIRTTNENGQSMKDQPDLWNKFFQENLKDKIPNKLTPDTIYGVYFDYEKDHTKPYSFLIGFEVNSFEKIPNNMHTHIIPAEKYALFIGKGKDNIEKVTKTWQNIWSSNIDRSFITDFELYDLSNPDSNVEIFIGIK